MIGTFHNVSQECSKITALRYSTSFSSAIKLLHKDLRTPIFNIYGFVRFADEIVDTFHEYDKENMLQNFKADTYKAIKDGISINPILHSFQITVNQYNIQHDLIEAFFHSMEMDLNKVEYDSNLYEEYIYGSAEVVGLMCLFVFCEGNTKRFDELKDSARSLGAAFQKVNFLRDVKAGTTLLSWQRKRMKNDIEEEIAIDFKNAYTGIKLLPAKSRFGVYVAYKYYLSLFKKIKQVQPATLLDNRVRIANVNKAFIVMRAGVRSQLNIL